MQLKANAPQKVNELLKVENIERILDQPEISDRKWGQMQLLYMNTFNIHVVPPFLSPFAERIESVLEN